MFVHESFPEAMAAGAKPTATWSETKPEDGPVEEVGNRRHQPLEVAPLFRSRVTPAGGHAGVSSGLSRGRLEPAPVC